MDFCIQLSADYPDKSYGGNRVYRDMIEQAELADRLGFESVAITEHHLINCLMMPAPLQFAVKIAAHTQRINVITAVVVLPLHDMRVFAGEVVAADIFTEQRLLLGVGRGAYKFEMERLGVPIVETQARFDESLEVLQTLLSDEEVSWKGQYYNFEPLTIMPRPLSPGGPPMMIAVVNPANVYIYARKGMHIQTTPLSGSQELLERQVESFRQAKSELDDAADDITLTLSRVAFISRNERDRRRHVEAAHAYYRRFDNVFTGPGIVDAGMIRALERNQTMEELAENVLICSPAEMVDRVAPYAELGIDRMVFNINFGVGQQEQLECVQALGEEVMPHFANQS
ncbi:MAG: LLM class flavin-dependent oxidoreductase [Acidiferrobacterales bacterium]|nr:LLM class flavin-dependent oxidoreductase [Acidiferrobacterales bacterium]